ncbi:hypothetical protein [Empedobacter brevis]|uniref:hypothetical protein n=1 Tax=Empedobacter brevis TaxID=247 RepID=UPI0013305A66|nr:hypothetical protein [Empedobacter brevis]
MKTDFTTASFKDFENIPDLDIYERAKAHEGYLNCSLNTSHKCIETIIFNIVFTIYI